MSSGAGYFPWPADRHIHLIDTPKCGITVVVEIHVSKQVMTEFCAARNTCVGHQPHWRLVSAESLTTTPHFLFPPVFSSANPSAWDQHRHVLTNGRLSFWLNGPKQRLVPGRPKSRHDPGPRWRNIAKSHRQPTIFSIRALQGFRSNQRMGKRPHHCPGGGCRRVRDREAHRHLTSSQALEPALTIRDRKRALDSLARQVQCGRDVCPQLHAAPVADVPSCRPVRVPACCRCSSTRRQPARDSRWQRVGYDSSSSTCFHTAEVSA
jgi:hypothetical protein